MFAGRNGSRINNLSKVSAIARTQIEKRHTITKQKCKLRVAKGNVEFGKRERAVVNRTDSIEGTVEVGATDDGGRKATRSRRS